MPATLALALPHANITSDADSASLVGNFFAQRCALHEPRELLGTENVKWCRLDLHAPINTRGHVAVSLFEVEILLLFGGFEQAEGQAILALVADRKIGENEVSSGGRSVQVGHARGGNTGQNGRVRLALHATRGNLAVLLEAGVEEEAGIVVKGNFLAFIE